MSNYYSESLTRELPIKEMAIALLLVGGFWKASSMYPSKAVEIAPTPTVVSVKATPTPKPIPVSEPNNPRDYITYIFGENDAKKAMLLLQGNGSGTCAENRNLDPKAYNRNWIKGKPGEFWSTDWNIFQVNDKFHPVAELDLKDDWKANIKYAKRMFDRDGGTFAKRWSCGKLYASQGFDI